MEKASGRKPTRRTSPESHCAKLAARRTMATLACNVPLQDRLIQRITAFAGDIVYLDRKGRVMDEVAPRLLYEHNLSQPERAFLGDRIKHSNLALVLAR